MMEGDRMNGDFAGVLKSALALPEEDKRRLAELMNRVTATDAMRVQIAPAPETGAETTPEIGAAEWVLAIRGESASVQVQLIEDALASTEDPSELQVLRGAQKVLLQENPPLAIRRAVERVAAEHPVGICVGGAGLLLALIAVARGLFRLVL